MKKKFNNKNIILVVISLALFIASFAITRAFLISNHVVNNKFTVGENKIKIEEEFKPPKELTPGVEFVKAPHVKNTGNTSTCVRMSAKFSNSEAKEFCEDLVINGDWVYNSSDGYYYYKKVLASSDSTSNLFEKIKVKDSVADSDLKDFDILVYAESKQPVNNACSASVWD